jgi:hypothetical protein
VLLAPALDGRARKPFDPAELDPDRLALRGGLDSGDKGCLARGSTSGGPVRAFAAEVGVIDFDALSRQWLVMVALQHDLHQLVLEFPRRILRHPQTTAQFDAGYALLALGQGGHRRKPRRQR